MNNKCFNCKKKTHIICKCSKGCNNSFCLKCLQPELHKCENILQIKEKEFEINKKNLMYNKTQSHKIDII